MPNLFRVIGQFLTRSESASTGNAVQIQNSTPETVLGVANQGRVSIKKDDSVATQSVAVIANSTSNSGLVLAPNGTGAIMADIPDGTSAGGNARGQYAVDLQMQRSQATHVASATGSVVLGGTSNTASGTNSTVLGGQTNTSSGTASISFGRTNTASGEASLSLGGGYIGGGGNTASGAYSVTVGGSLNTASGGGSVVIGNFQNIASADNSIVAGGSQARAYLYGQSSRAAGNFAAPSDAQTSAITFRRSITGTAQTELFLDGASIQAILALPTGATNARAWSGRVDLVAIVVTPGAGGLAQDDCFMGNYTFAIRRRGTTTAMIGTSTYTISDFYDPAMMDCVVTIEEDNTNEALSIKFTPPTTADANTVIRVVATAYLTEVGR